VNSRERFIATMTFQPPDRAPLWEFGYWGGTIGRWYGEGLPKKRGLNSAIGYGDAAFAEAGSWDELDRLREFDVHDALQLDEGLRRIPLNNYFSPPFETRVIEDHGDWVVWVDEKGVTKRDRKDKATLSNFLSGPVQTREDWERLKAERLQPTLAGRLPDFWPRLLGEYAHRDYPVSIGARHGFFGTPRYLLGLEQLLVTYYDDPQLIKDINAYMTDFWISIYDQVIAQVRPKPDAGVVWEDMCYKTGSLISPAMFREFMLPSYRKLTGFFRDHGINIVLVDTDGNFGQLVPLFLEGGVTCLYPCEVAAGMDVVELRRAYPRMAIMGGIDKRMIAGGKALIDDELGARISQALEQPGFIPFIDHLVPPDISWPDFVYYRQRLKDLILARSSVGG
jgi:Uroporphyrinogen decarboxylase (URO-D)